MGMTIAGDLHSNGVSGILLKRGKMEFTKWMCACVHVCMCACVCACVCVCPRGVTSRPCPPPPPPPQICLFIPWPTGVGGGDPFVHRPGKGPSTTDLTGEDSDDDVPEPMDTGKPRSAAAKEKEEEPMAAEDRQKKEQVSMCYHSYPYPPVIQTLYHMWQSQVENWANALLSGLVISLECFIEITPDFLCPFMND